DVGVAKTEMDTARLFALAVLAGAFISLGALFSTVVTSGGGTPPGISRLLGGVVFALGLVLVVVGGAELFTGNTLVIVAIASRRVRLTHLLRNWAIVYLGNIVGALATAILVVLSRRLEAGDGSIGVRALDIAGAKTSLAVPDAFVSGILANALVCLAVWLSMSARSVTDKVIAIVPPVSAFVAAGFEHSIANLYFVPVALFHRLLARAAFWRTTSTTADDYQAITWPRFVVRNLVPVTLGNIVGGALLVGLTYWFVYLRPGPSRTP
ncbi:MAG: formate/nitrite transporter family protein, partial [Actinomycetota bacterium]|nr:formate/nitrite transporter family protein [Actinomycetota bacterium]